MSVIGIAMLKDEEDVAREVIEHMLGQVDSLIVADNDSSDGTRAILDELKGERLLVLDDHEPGYYQSEKMTGLASIAAEMGADWVVPFDADEWWYSRFHDSVADCLRSLAPQWWAAAADLFDHVSTGQDHVLDLNPFTRMGWRRREPLPLPKVAARTMRGLVIEQGNHSVRIPGGAPTARGDLCVRHFPYRSAEHFVRKARNGAAAYAASDLPEEMGAHWRGYGAILEADGEEACAGIFREWFYVEDPKSKTDLIYDPAPVGP